MPLQQCVCGNAWYRGKYYKEPDSISAENTLKCTDCNGLWRPNYGYFGSGVAGDESYTDYYEDKSFVEHLTLEGCYKYANSQISPFNGTSKIKGIRKKGISTWSIDNHGPKLKHGKERLLEELKWALYHIHNGKSDSDIPLQNMYVRKIAMLLKMKPNYTLKVESHDKIIITSDNAITPRPRPIKTKKHNSRLSRSYPARWVHIIYKRDNYKCRECGATNKDTVLHIDHIIPVSKGGRSVLSNLQTLCRECNMAKFNRIWED